MTGLPLQLNVLAGVNEIVDYRARREERGGALYEYVWSDGAAIVTQLGGYGGLWLRADTVTCYYAWSSWGYIADDSEHSDFRRWLCDVATRNPEYVVMKLEYGRPQEYDAQATDREVRAWIMYGRRQKWFTREAARHALDRWERCAPTNDVEFHDWYTTQSGYDIHAPEDHEPVVIEDIGDVYRSKPNGHKWISEHVPRLAVALRNDLMREARASAVAVAVE